jgi:hypothetical protein
MKYNEINNKDKMWYTLGVHFCKSKQYYHIIKCDIFNRHFKKSHKLETKFTTLYKYLTKLASVLDDIIQTDYIFGINNLESIETQPSINSVFYSLYSYNNGNIVNYNEKIDESGNIKTLYLRPYPCLGEKKSEKFTTEEKAFIDIFINNFNEYLVNIQFLLNYNLKCKDLLEKNIQKIQTYLYKLITEINNVPIF